MEQINQIWNHPLYRECLTALEAQEKDRIFCRHDLEHALAVARLAMIFNLQGQYGVDPKQIYAAALLHDCGRWAREPEPVPHEEAGAQLAEHILRDCGFREREIREITAAIAGHRDPAVREEPTLRGLLYRADKASRSCFACPAEPQCNWAPEKKNLTLEW